MNLIGNAIKFTEKGYVKVVVKLISDTADGYKILMEFIDTGIGISEEELPGIFDNFRQANVSIRRKFGGTGLGLAITKKLVEAQNAAASNATVTAAITATTACAFENARRGRALTLLACNGSSSGGCSSSCNGGSGSE